MMPGRNSIPQKRGENYTITSSLSAEVTDDELTFCKYLTRRTIATDRFYF